jgi:hypothetical protein
MTTKTQTAIASPQILASMTFFASTMEQESMQHNINSQQNFETFSLKPNSQRKIRVRTIVQHFYQLHEIRWSI